MHGPPRGPYGQCLQSPSRNSPTLNPQSKAMSEYEEVRSEFFRLQNSGSLVVQQVHTVEIVGNGRRITGHPRFPGFSGVSIHRRKQDNTLICEEACRDGAADGCARYYDQSGELVGEDYYSQGGVFQTRVFK